MTSRARTPARTTQTASKTKKPAAKKPAAKKPAAKKPTAKKPTAKKPTAKKPTAKKPTAKKPAAKKPAAKKPAAKKPTAKKPTAKKPAARKPAAKKPVARAQTRRSPATAPRGPFLDLAPFAGASSERIAAALEAAPWDSFDSARDLVALRDLLRDLEAREGVGAAHRLASAQLLERKRARLVHGLVHHVAISAIGLSHDGRHLATGSWCGDDYDRGGTLQIWEVEAGRCVHVLDRIPGGVGWPDYGRQIQWSPDDTRLGVGFNTNVVGVFAPFGDGKPTCTMDVTQGWSRPPSWCWSPGGDAIAVACWKWGVPPKIPLVIARPLRPRVDDDDVAGMQPNLPDDLAAQLSEDTPLQPMTEPLWCADGVIRGYNKHGQVFAVDAATGAIVWHGKVHEPLQFSPDGRYFATSPAGLAIYDGATGLPTPMLPMVVGAREYVWAPGDASPRRLAMVVDGDNEFGAEPGTHIFDDGKLLVSLDEVPRAARWDEPDFRGLAFSRDGQRLLLLDEEGRLHAFALAPGAARKLWGCALEGVSGVLWAAGDVAIALGADLVVFLDGATGEPRARHLLRPEPTEDSPLNLDGADLGAKLVPSPLLAVDCDGDRRWAVVFPEGPIVCPDGARAQLDGLVSLSIDRRFAWPLRWADVPTHADLAAAARDPSLPLPKAALAKLAKLARSRRAAEPQGEPWPPATGGSLGDLLAAHCAWLDELSGGWAYHVADHREYIATIHARLGDPAAARACVAAIDDHGYLLRAAASIAVELAAAGHTADARALAERAREAAVHALTNEHDKSMGPASLAAALAVLGDPAADARFAEAEADLFPETNAFQHVGHLATLLAGLGRDEHALAVILKGPWDGGDIRENYFIRALSAMTARGRFDLIERFFDHYFACDPWHADKVLHATVGVLLARGDFARALAWLPRFERCSTDDLERRAIRGLWDSDQRTAAWQHLEPRLDDRRWLAFAAALDPTRVADAIEARLAAAGDDYDDLVDLAEAATRTGAGARALAHPASDDGARLALATGVLRAAPPPDLRDAAVALAREPLTRVRNADRVYLSHLGVAAHKAGAADLAAAAFARAQSFAVGRDVRWVVSEIVRIAAEPGALGAAHAALLRMPRAQRIYEIRPLITGCALHGEFAAAIHLLSQLPNSDLNDRCNVSLTAIAAAACARLPGLGEPY